MPKVYLESLGCARNQVDSENMLALLRASGWSVTDAPEEADAIVVNTCSFIESAADESIDTILALARYKTRGRCKRLIVAGCLPERYGRDSIDALPEVDLFLGTGAYDQVAAAVAGTTGDSVCLLPDPDNVAILSPPSRQPLNRHAAYLKIAEGCNRSCTFCIIPKLRGRQKSRSFDAIVAEARTLISGGAKELTLVAQETTAYGRDLVDGPDLAHLMAALADLDPSVWIRFLYGHPQSISSAVIETAGRYANICPYFDIPIQHAADGILRRMGRNYTAKDLVHLFDGIRSRLPQAALRTTVLVGFPGETEADVDQLAGLITRIQFDHLGVFLYSDAEDLPSHGLKPRVATRVAQQRLDRLMQLQKGISEERLARLDGQRMTVLVEQMAEPGLYAARTMFQAPEVDGGVLVRSAHSLAPGTMIAVKIVETLEYDLIGEVA
ncbi:MAG: 30S ribosomal protein S12 methylthiotransferase RimO [Desulfobacteraceae bacterium]